jgi:hypothetical protein
VQSYAIKAGVRQYRAREIAGLVQQGDREVRIAAADLRSCCKISHVHRFNSSRIMLIWIIAALLVVNLS